MKDDFELSMPPVERRLESYRLDFCLSEGFEQIDLVSEQTGDGLFHYRIDHTSDQGDVVESTHYNMSTLTGARNMFYELIKEIHIVGRMK